MEKTTALIALLGAISGLLGTLTRFAWKGWKAITVVMDKIDDTADRVTTLENAVKVNAQQRSREATEIKDKLPEA